MAIRDKLYSYSEAQAAFPFIYDKKEGVLYFAQGKQGAAFVIPINYKSTVSGDLYLLERDKLVILNNNEGVFLSIKTGVVNITGSLLNTGETVLQLKNIYGDEELQIANLRNESIEITISPRVPSNVYILKFKL